MPDHHPMKHFELTSEEYKLFCELIYRVAGIRIADNKRVMVSNRVRRRLRATGIESFAGYFTFLTSPSGGDEMPEFLDAITTNETYFFRDPHQYEWLGNTFFPEMAAAAGLRKPKKEPEDLVGGVQHGRRALLDCAQAAGAEVALPRVADHGGRNRPERRGAGRGPVGQLRCAGRAAGRARRSASVLRRGQDHPSLDHTAGGQSDGHVETAQPAAPAWGRAI